MDAAVIEKREECILGRERVYRRVKWAAIGLAVFVVVMSAGACLMARLVDLSAPADSSQQMRAMLADVRDKEFAIYLTSEYVGFLSLMAAGCAQARLRHVESIRFYRDAG